MGIYNRKPNRGASPLLPGLVPINEPVDMSMGPSMGDAQMPPNAGGSWQMPPQMGDRMGPAPGQGGEWQMPQAPSGPGLGPIPGMPNLGNAQPMPLPQPIGFDPGMIQGPPQGAPDWGSLLGGLLGQQPGAGPMPFMPGAGPMPNPATDPWGAPAPSLGGYGRAGFGSTLGDVANAGRRRRF